MNNRQRFINLMHYEPIDRLPIHLTNIWPDTMARWVTEGYPEGMPPEAYFDIEPMPRKHLGIATWPYPPHEERVVEETENEIIRIDGYGRTVRDFKNATSMPEWIDFPVKTPDDLRRFIDDHFSLDRLEERVPVDLEKDLRYFETFPDHNTLLFLDGGCYYWTLRSITGVELASLMFYDAPELVDELFEKINRVCLEGMRRVLPRVKVDYIGFGEDIAYKTSTLISPDMFDKYLAPRYRAIMDLAHEHGVDIAWYDSDGNLFPFMDRYLDIGINGFAPCEVAAGMDPVAMRERFGREVRIVGGFDKRLIARGPKAIDAEFERLRPVIDQGGYLPSIDHSVSADISLENYRYFVEKLKGYRS